MSEKATSSKVEFVPPKGFRPPANTDKEWDMVCSFRSNSDGSICMTKLGETDMPGYGANEEHDENAEHKPDYGAYSKGIMDAGNAMGAASSQQTY